MQWKQCTGEATHILENKKKDLKIDNLCFHLKKIEKEQIKLKVSRKKKQELEQKISEIKNKKPIEKIKTT